MDTPSRDVVRMLEAIADSNSQFIELASRLRSRPDITRVHHDLDCRKYLTGSVVQIYVEAELESANSVTWWLDLRWNEDHWFVEGRVLVDNDQGQDTVREYPDRTADTLDACIKDLLQVTADLVSSVDSIDFAVVANL